MRLRRIAKVVWDGEYHEYVLRAQVNTVRRRFKLGPIKRDADVKAKAILKGIASGRITFDQPATTQQNVGDGRLDMRLEEVLHRYLAWLKANRAPTTFEMRRHYLRRFQRFMGPCMVSNVTRLRLEDFHAQMRREHPTRPNGGNEFLRHVKTALLWAEEVGLCTCPVSHFPKISCQATETKRVALDALHTFLEGAPTDLQDVVVFGLLTGLRPQELCALQCDHIRLDADGRRFIQLSRHKTSATARMPAPRSVPLSDEAAAIVDRRQAAHPFVKHVFANADGGPYTSRSLRQRIERRCIAAGMEPFCTYALRHTFASLQAEAGINQLALTALMGHTSVRTTSRYVSNTDQFNRTAMGTLAARVHDVVMHPQKAETAQKCGRIVAGSGAPGKDKKTTTAASGSRAAC